MKRDIDEIIARVTEALPGVRVSEYKCLDGTWDEGIWSFGLPGISSDIQIESFSGACPFVVETNEQWGGDAIRASTTAEAIAFIVQYLQAMSEGRSVRMSGERPKLGNP